jgi:dTDP-glucose 4,6-dehydratase
LKILVTGGAGFIGSHFVRRLLSEPGVENVIVLDNLTYAGRIENLEDFKSDSRFRFVKGDIRDINVVEGLLREVNYLVNFAAESHVDRSISDSSSFINSNIVGTHTLLEAVKKRTEIRYLQVSTDEVYGSIPSGHWTEDSPLLPNSPYSASKASADLLVRAFNVTYGIDTVTTRCSNNFGSHQYPEKLIPLSIIKLMAGKKLQIYGNGLNVRDWLHVKDHCEGIFLALTKGRSGAVYNFGADSEKTNLEIAHVILDQMGLNQSSIEFVADRLGHDLRYSVSFEKAKSDLSFVPRISFEDGMRDTIDWYLNNEPWWKDLVAP